MSERIRGSYDDALYKSTYTLLYFTVIMITWNCEALRAACLFVCLSVCENMTSSTKLEVHNARHCHQKRTEPRPPQVNVCLLVCLSVRISQKPHVLISPNFLLMLLVVAVARYSSDGSAVRYVLPVLWTTSGSEWARIKDDAYVSFSSPGGGTRSEVCRLRLHLCTEFLYRAGMQRLDFYRPGTAEPILQGRPMPPQFFNWGGK